MQLCAYHVRLFSDFPQGLMADVLSKKGVRGVFWGRK